MRSNRRINADLLERRSAPPAQAGEFVLGKFLDGTLAKRYTVSTGKVVSIGGHESGQVDLIVHDRLNTPALIEGRA